MKSSVYFITAYALLLFVGGIVGYAKAQSLMSLIMGIGSSLLLLACVGATWKGYKWGHMGSLILLSLLTLFFIYRFFITYKFMPAGMMAIIGVLVSSIAYGKTCKKLSCCSSKSNCR
jgi:uncharacterized membrane protein (UPF0136 family)